MTPPSEQRTEGGAGWGEGHPARCLNCGTDRVGAYCHACGQGEVDPAAPVSVLVSEGVQDALSWDHRVVRSIRVLLVKPGGLSEAWAAGRRASFVAPLRLFLVLGAVLVGVGLIHDQLAGWVIEGVAEEQGGAEEPDRTTGSTLDAAYWAGRVLGEMGVNSFLALTPFVGFAYFVLFNSRCPRLAHHLVHALHLACVGVFGLVLWRVSSLAWLLTNPTQTLGDSLLGREGLAVVLGMLVLTVYTAASIRQFYGASRFKTVLAAPLVVAVPASLILGLVLVIYLILLAL